MSTSTRKFMRGEIYYVKSFPTCGHEQRSGRPAVIVSSNEINAHSEVVEVCYLTLKDKPNFPTHIFIDRGPCINSTVLCEQITSIATDRIGDYMCRIPEHLEEALDNAIRTSLALFPLAPSSGYDVVERIPDEVMSELDKFRCENMHLHKELEMVKDANKTIKEKAAENFKALASANARADMYERMYNDLLNRIIGGAR